MTQEEFNNYHKEYALNFQAKYREWGINFDTIMKWHGCSGEEFNEKLRNLEHGNWVERRDSDDSWDYSSSGREDVGEEYNDDEYDY